MELKGYQYKVINDLGDYFAYLVRYGKTDLAFDRFWQDRIGPYNPVTGEGMEPYKNTIPGAAHVCIKVPTAGGKTFIACNALYTIFKSLPAGMPKVAVWLVPWSNLLDQTVSNLRNPEHPYRQKLNSLFSNRVEVYEKKDLLQGSNFNPSVVSEQLSVIVMSFSSLRIRNREDRKVYQENGQLAGFADQYTDKSFLLEGIDDTALINVIRSLNPVLVVDESHNAESELSVDMLRALNPSVILDLTATPKANSNIISLVPAMELKKEHMVKLPVIVYNHHDKTGVIDSALHLRRQLEIVASAEEKQGGKYIRPIVLFQAQPKTNEENTTFLKIKEQLLRVGIPEEEIKIKTAERDELKGINLMSRECPVRYIITINALKEGWDCPFAYILASLADKSSVVDVEQILGRVLRQPYVMKHSESSLNLSYVLTASAKFTDTLQSIVAGLQESGFSSRDYREKDLTAEPKSVISATRSSPLFLENEISDEEIIPERISFSPAASADTRNPVVEEIQAMAASENSRMEAIIEQQKEQNPDEPIFQEMEGRVKRYQMLDTYRAVAYTIKLPKFFLKHSSPGIFGELEHFPLSQEVLLKDFRLSTKDVEINFEQLSSDLYKVDIEQTHTGESDARFTKFEPSASMNQVMELILAKPREGQIKDIAHQLVQTIGNIPTVPEQEIRVYTNRVLEDFNTEQLQEVILRRSVYAEKVKQRIRQHMDAYAELKFDEAIKLKKIEALPSWPFPEAIVPGLLGPAIGHSLYEREGSMNQFESRVITEIAGLTNVLCWHRNLGRGKGFSINGYKNNHYPDFIIITKTGGIILVETKGDDRDNSDSSAKCRLGNRWAELAGKQFNYFMVFDQVKLSGAYTLDEALDLIRQIA